MRRHSFFKLPPLKAGNPQNFFSARRPLLLIPLLILAGCSVVASLPGMDRIINPNSSAEVGPLLTQLDDRPVLPPEAENQATTANNEATAPVNKESAGDLKQQQAPQPITRSNDQPPPTALPTTAKPPAPSPTTIPAREPKNADTGTQQTPAAAAPTGDEPKVEPIPTGRLSGTVILQGEKKDLLSPEGTLITLVPAQPLPPREHRETATYEIDMEKKIYSPGILAISSADRVVFANKDKIRHNVFSSSGKNAFDLGTYGAGLKRSVALKEPGIVKVYCNIHAEMATFIAVGEPGLTTVTSAQGTFSLADLVPGKYRLHAWNIRGEAWSDLDIQADKTRTLSVTIQVAESNVESHTNKFGKIYPKNTTQFDDEFY
jgi:plastocyanin